MNKVNRQNHLPAMILAAGLGTRLRPLTKTIPKALAPVGGQPLIHYSLEWLRAQGVREAIVNTHYFGAMIERELGDGSRWGMNITYSREEELLGTGGGIGQARKYFGRRRILVANADTILDVDLSALMTRHEAGGAIATLALVEEKAPGVYTSILVDEADRVRAIGGKPEGQGSASDHFRAMTFTGLSILEPELVDYLPDNRFAHLAADGLIPALADGKVVAGYQHHGYWRAIDDLTQVRAAEADLAAGRLRPF